MTEEQEMFVEGIARACVNRMELIHQLEKDQLEDCL